MKKTQQQRVIEVLKSQGFVTRNWALSQYISRLSAIIQDLESIGWEFVPYRDGGDYGYRVAKPATRLEIRVVEKDGKYYPTKVEVPV